MTARNPLITVAAAVAFAVPTAVRSAGIEIEYAGCGGPLTLRAASVPAADVWQRLAERAGFELRGDVRAVTGAVTLNVTGPVPEVVAALARGSSTIVIDAHDADCLGGVLTRSVWLMPEGRPVAGAVEYRPGITEAASVAAEATPFVPQARSVGIRFVEAPDGSKVRVAQPNQRRYLKDLERGRDPNRRPGRRR